MSLSWVFLGSGQTGDSRPQDVPASMIQDVRDIAARKGGTVGSLEVVLHLYNGGIGGASYEVENLKTDQPAATVFICWTQAGCEHWWHAAVTRQMGNALDPGVPCACSEHEAPPIPWMAIAEFSGEGKLTAKQIDLELATAWALIALYGDDDKQETTAVRRYVT